MVGSELGALEKLKVGSADGTLLGSDDGFAPGALLGVDVGTSVVGAQVIISIA